MNDITIISKPLSVNECWQGKRFKTKKYLQYERDILFQLPSIQIPSSHLSVCIEWGMSSSMADIDNPTKPFLDILQKKYNFDDKVIFKLLLTKTIVKKGQEYIKFKIDGIQ